MRELNWDQSEKPLIVFSSDQTYPEDAPMYPPLGLPREGAFGGMSILRRVWGHVNFGVRLARTKVRLEKTDPGHLGPGARS